MSCSNEAANTITNLNLQTGASAKIHMPMCKKIFPPLWRRQKTKKKSSTVSVFSWDEASYECQKSEGKYVTIERIPTAIEYSSPSSTDDSLASDHERIENMSRYSVPMDIEETFDIIVKETTLNQCEITEIVDKYSIIDQDFENNDGDDDDDNKSALFGSLNNDSFMSDTALRDEINNEREKIKQSFMQAKENNCAVKQKRHFFNIAACFGSTNTAYSHSYNLESPMKKPYTMRHTLGSDEFLQLD